MKRIISFALILVLFMTVYLGEASANPFPVSYTTYDTTYEAILKMYIRVLNAGGDEGRHHDLFNTKVIVFDMDTSWLKDIPKDELNRVISAAKHSFGYMIQDLNGDGVDELIIGDQNGNVIELFTLENGRVRELVHAWYKKDCQLLEDGKIHSYTHGDGSFVVDSVWTMNGTGDLLFVEGYQYDYNVDSFARDGINQDVGDTRLWFRMRSGEDKVSSDDTLVSLEEYFNWHNGLKAVKFSIIPFAAYEQGIDYVNAGIISVKGKIDGREKVNIRKKPSKKSGIVTTLKTGTFVEILGEEDDFYRISFSNKEGYVQKAFLTLWGDVSPAQNQQYGEGIEKSPQKPETPSEVESRPDPSVKNEDDEYYYESVLDHYEEIEVQRSRQVYDHDEYTMVDNGKGEFVEVAHPVYRTEYYTEIEQRPVYIQVRRKKGE